jgi:hypothetical protein
LQGLRGLAGGGQCVGEPLIHAVPQRQSRKHDPRRPRGRPARARAPRPGDHGIDPARGSGRHASHAPVLTRSCAFRSTILAPAIRA